MKVRDLRQLHGTISAGGLLKEYQREGLKKRIEYFGFSTRVRNALRRRHIDTLEQLLDLTPMQLKHIKNIGATSVKEIDEFLSDRGLKLRPEVNQTQECI